MDPELTMQELLATIVALLRQAHEQIHRGRHEDAKYTLRRAMEELGA